MKRTIFTIVLNYRSANDTVRCVNSLREQTSVDMTIIVVDNSECEKNESELLRKIEKHVTETPFVLDYSGVKQVLTESPKSDFALLDHRFILIRNAPNRGYSSGNNVGIRYALARGASAIFIVNPDLLFPHKNTSAVLLEKLFSRKECLVIGPRVINKDCKDQNPMRELTFFQEFLQPICDLYKKQINKNKYIIEGEKQSAPVMCSVDKLIGCCLMIKPDFLRKAGLLDENVFLYCEEPILAHKVKSAGGMVCYYPGTEVQHLHEESKVSANNYLLFIQSRLYYLRTYKKYDFFRLSLIITSHYTLYLIKLFKERIGHR